MNNLETLLSAYPENHPVYLTENGEITKNDILHLDISAAYEGKSIALFFDDPAIFLVAFIKLDGFASKIYFGTAAVGDSIKDTKNIWDYILTDNPRRFPDSIKHKVRSIGSIEDFSNDAAESKKTSNIHHTTWYVSTSGTTGEPKFISHEFAGIAQKYLQEYSKRAVRKVVWATMFPLTRFAGLLALLQSLAFRKTLIVHDPIDTKRFIEVLIKYDCKLLSGTPTMWRRLLFLTESRNLDFENISMSGEIADERLLTALRNRYKKAKIQHIYGAAELGSCFPVSDGLSGFPISFIPFAPNGRGVKVVDGKLYVSKFTRAVEADEEFDTVGDMVELRGDRYYFLGRSSGLINVGGLKAYPEEIEQILLKHPDVAAANVYGRSNPFSGQLVSADLVLEDGRNHADTIQSVKKHCRDYLAPFKQPARYQIIDEIRINDGRKMARNETR